MDKKTVKSLLKGLTILDAFTPQNVKLGFQELVLKTGLPKTTVFRFLHTLALHDYLSFDSKSHKYFLGPKAILWGFTVFSSLDLRELALPYMEKLAEETGQNVNLGILDDTDVIFIERIRKNNIIDINLHIGSRLNLYQTSIGRALLAFSNQKKIGSILNKLLKNPEAMVHIGQEGEKLIKLLKEIRHKGYALSDEEFIKGIRSIAAPIFNAQGDVEGAINIPVFTHTVSRKELIKRYVPLLLDTVEKISTARGFH